MGEEKSNQIRSNIFKKTIEVFRIPKPMCIGQRWESCLLSSKFSTSTFQQRIHLEVLVTNLVSVLFMVVTNEVISLLQQCTMVV